ncbi:MAG: 3-oxo-tetronate kinase [Pyrinomonadaceae bacterium]
MTSNPKTNSDHTPANEPERLVFAAVADDDTGASDLAGMLAEQDVCTLLVLDLPPPARFAEWTRGYQAVVMAEGTRNLTPAAAYARTRAAIRLLQTRRPHLFQLKYCSTFDSTPEGNIGPSIEAALDELGEDFTVAVPALPVNGRTTYQGYHFVHRQLLSDSSMREHPLTPMTNPNLVELLGRQMKRRVGLAPYGMAQAGADVLKKHLEELRAGGVGVALVDCLDDEHLENICRAVADLRLVTGSSAFGMKLPAIWRERGLLTEKSSLPTPSLSTAVGGGCLLVAGSCSAATLRQNEWAAKQGIMVRYIPPPSLLHSEPDRAQIVAEARGELAAGRHYLLTTSGAANDVRQAQEWGAARGLSVPALGEALAYALAELVLEVVNGQTVGGLIVAGGETSGAVCRRLELGAMQVGRNIEPGVPLCHSLGRFRLPLVLKSGNFGSPDFYGKAVEAVARGDEYLHF